MVCLMLIVICLISGRYSQMVDVFPTPFVYGMATENITIYFNASWKQIPKTLKITRTKQPYFIGSIRRLNESCIFSTEVPDEVYVTGICESQTLTGKLEMYDIKEYDDKQNLTFKLHITNRHIITKNTTIFILVPVEEVIMSTDFIISFGEQSSNISCRASSRPSANITWFMTSLKAEKKQIQSNITYESDLNGTKSVLSFRGKKENNGNTIHCEASSLGSHQTISSSKATITVYYGPGQKLLIRKSEIKERNQVIISCFADCNPICSYVWTHDGVTKSNSSDLILESTTLDNSEPYTCEAFNEFDNQTHTGTKSILLVSPADSHSQSRTTRWGKKSIVILSSVLILAVFLGIVAVLIICKKIDIFTNKETPCPKKKRKKKNSNVGLTKYDGSYRDNSLYIPFEIPLTEITSPTQMSVKETDRKQRNVEEIRKTDDCKLKACVKTDFYSEIQYDTGKMNCVENDGKLGEKVNISDTILMVDVPYANSETMSLKNSINHEYGENAYTENVYYEKKHRFKPMPAPRKMMKESIEDCC